MVKTIVLSAVLAAALVLLAARVHAQKLCPDGTYVSGNPLSGTCVLTPDGRYVAGPDSGLERRRSGDASPPNNGGIGRGFREGVERSRQRRLEEERLELERERVRIERERLDLERKRAGR